MWHAAVVMTAVTGCSFQATRGPDFPARPGACTTSGALPLLDRVAAIAITVVGTAVLGVRVASGPNVGATWAQTVEPGLGVLVASVPWWASSRIGYDRISRCETAHDEETRRAFDAETRVNAALAKGTPEILAGLLAATQRAVANEDCDVASQIARHVRAIDTMFYLETLEPELGSCAR